MPGAKNILIIEDDEQSRQVVRLAMQSQSYLLTEAKTGDEGLEVARSSDPDLILLDINMPGMSGLDVCRKLRAEGSLVPIIMLTAKSDTIDKVVGLEVGADDYITKPFEVRELMARIGAHLRRSDATTGEPTAKTRREFPGLVIDISRRQVWRDGRLSAGPRQIHPQGARGFHLKRTNRRSYLTAPPVMPAMKRSRKKL